MERGVELASTPGEDHAQLGEVESLIGKFKKDVRTYMRDKDCDPFLAVLYMVHAHNTLGVLHRVNGSMVGFPLLMVGCSMGVSVFPFCVGKEQRTHQCNSICN